MGRPSIINRLVLIFILAAIFQVTTDESVRLVTAQEGVANPQFLSLPFLDPTVKIQQGWFYTDGNIHKPKGAIDYIKGILDNSSTWSSFEVVAGADGKAMWSAEKGYGNFVLIRHEEKDANGLNFFTLYAHLEDDSIPTKIPFLERHNSNFEQWVPVKRGEIIGKAGHTGWSDCRTTCVHLHFEVLRGGYFQNQTDAYDIHQTSKRDKYPCDNCDETVLFRTGSNFTGCGPNQLWTICPPMVPISISALTQHKSDGITSIPLGGTTDEDTVVMKGVVNDPGGNPLQLEVEVQPVGTDFTGTPSCNSGPAVASGETATATCSNLANGSYHWQGRAKNSQGTTSNWLSAGGNLESDADFIIEATPPPTTVNIDFENFPGPDGVLGTADDVPTNPGTTEGTGDSVSNQYCTLGAIFALADGSSPTIIHPAFPYLPASPRALLPMAQGGVYEQDIQDLVISFTTPASRVQISALDADESWTLRAFNASSSEIASDSHSPAGDHDVVPGQVSVDGSQAFITRVVIDLTEGRGAIPGPEFYDLLEYDPTGPIDASGCGGG